METNQTIRLAIEEFVQFLASTSQWETHSKKRSMVSTLSPLEAILWHTKPRIKRTGAAFLDEGSRYLWSIVLYVSNKTGLSSIRNG
ncbi:hypothetical protein SAMN04488688_101934 [Paenibacillus sp. cl141a]|uniref:hypothetical protein n=1 Tax=Paenibacillus sp. cl141a TaxID=1761877 RepID=UPI0008B87676|nr:hypothetical protein [Paenibacillus sp. cl141a]SEK51121.1 hypothetical protein SAMN04488688_101934 [Paenibacillus sp. cl141a]